MNARDFSPIECGKVAPAPTHIPAPRPQPLDAARAQPDYLGMDDMSVYAQTLPKRDLFPTHLVTRNAPRHNLCAEFSALPTDQLLAEAEAAMTRLLQSGRPTDYAVVVALVRRLARKPALDGALWIDDMQVPA